MSKTECKSLPKILYIEDNADALLLVGRLMRGRYVMLEAQDPLIGIQVAEKTQPDLILLDLNLPNMNGMEVVVHLRSILKPGTPILALTADSISDIRERALAAGFSGFMSKPIDIGNFYEQIDAFLGEKHKELPNAASLLQA